jgi:hypothetical protein
MSGAVMMSVCWRSSAALKRSSPWTQGKNQLRPVPEKIALYAAKGSCPVATTTRPPTKNARTAAASAVKKPPRPEYQRLTIS